MIVSHKQLFVYWMKKPQTKCLTLLLNNHEPKQSKSNLRLFNSYNNHMQNTDPSDRKGCAFLAIFVTQFITLFR